MYELLSHKKHKQAQSKVLGKLVIILRIQNAQIFLKETNEN